jgi:NitT/TauT family transport system substrate-binding protein
MRSSRWIAAALVAIGLATPAAAQEKLRLSFTAASMLYAPVYVADAMGYFRQQGLEVENVHFKAGGSAALAAVLGGNVDIYVGAASSAMRAVDKGTDAVVIGALMTQFSINAVMRGDIARERGITPASTEAERLKALKGLRIGVSGAGSGTHQIMQYMLARAGLNPERDATIAFLGGGSDVLAAFVAKRIDAAAFSNPASDLAVQKHGGFLLVDGAAGQLEELNGFLYVTLITSRRWLARNPDKAVRTVRAFQQALTAMHDPVEGPKARDAIHPKYFEQTEKPIFDAAWTALNPAFPKSIAVERAHVEKVVKFLNNFSDEKYGDDVAKLYTNELAEAARK